MNSSSNNLRSIDGIKLVKPSQTTIPRKRLGLYKRWKIYIFVLIVALLCLGGYLYHRHQQTNLQGLSELTSVENRVSKLYLLPTNEVPALATVTNSSKLSTSFFKQSKNGDKILIYQKNKIALIYRPSINKIILVAPVNITSPPSSN